MCDPSLREEIERSVEEIRKLWGISPQLPADWELALELGKDGETGEPICSYYFVCLSTRCLFWLHDFDLDSVLAEVCGVTERPHIRESIPPSDTRRTKSMTRPSITSSVLVGDHHISRMALWLIAFRCHWEMFPHNREVPEVLLQELSGILLHAGIGTSGPRFNSR